MRIMSTTKKLLLGTTAGIVALAAAALPASAKGGHRHHRAFYGPVVVTSGPVGCDYYYWKWKRTGVRIWKSKYFACMG